MVILGKIGALNLKFWVDFRIVNHGFRPGIDLFGLEFNFINFEMNHSISPRFSCLFVRNEKSIFNPEKL